MIDLTRPPALPARGETEMGELTFVYVIGRIDGPVKVGITTCVRSRLTMLQTGCPFKLEIFGVWPFETRELARGHEWSFHEVYKKYRAAGEWFNVDAYQAIEGVQCSIQTDEVFRVRAYRERLGLPT